MSLDRYINSRRESPRDNSPYWRVSVNLNIGMTSNCMGADLDKVEDKTRQELMEELFKPVSEEFEKFLTNLCHSPEITCMPNARRIFDKLFDNAKPVRELLHKHIYGRSLPN